MKKVNLFEMKNGVVYSCSQNNKFYRVTDGMLENSHRFDNGFTDCSYTLTSARFIELDENGNSLKTNFSLIELEIGSIYTMKNSHFFMTEKTDANYVQRQGGSLYGSIDFDGPFNILVNKVDMRQGFLTV